MDDLNSIEVGSVRTCEQQQQGEGSKGDKNAIIAAGTTSSSSGSSSNSSNANTGSALEQSPVQTTSCWEKYVTNCCFSSSEKSTADHDSDDGNDGGSASQVFGTFLFSVLHLLDISSDIYMVAFYASQGESAYFAAALSVLIISAVTFFAVAVASGYDLCTTCAMFILGPASKYVASATEKEALRRDSDFKHRRAYHSSWLVGVVGLCEDIPQAVITLLFLTKTGSDSTGAVVQVASSIGMGAVKFLYGMFLFAVWACCGYETED